MSLCTAFSVSHYQHARFHPALTVLIYRKSSDVSRQRIIQYPTATLHRNEIDLTASGLFQYRNGANEGRSQRLKVRPNKISDVLIKVVPYKKEQKLYCCSCIIHAPLTPNVSIFRVSLYGRSWNFTSSCWWDRKSMNISLANVAILASFIFRCEEWTVRYSYLNASRLRNIAQRGEICILCRRTFPSYICSKLRSVWTMKCIDIIQKESRRWKLQGKNYSTCTHLYWFERMSDYARGTSTSSCFTFLAI